MAALGVFGFLIFIGVGIAQAYVGFLGIEYHFGEVWGWVAIGAAFILRIMFPLTIATYFGAVDVLGWPWYGRTCTCCARVAICGTCDDYSSAWDCSVKR